MKKIKKEILNQILCEVFTGILEAEVFSRKELDAALRARGYDPDLAKNNVQHVQKPKSHGAKKEPEGQPFVPSDEPREHAPLWSLMLKKYAPENLANLPPETHQRTLAAVRNLVRADVENKEIFSTYYRGAEGPRKRIARLFKHVATNL